MVCLQAGVLLAQALNQSAPSPGSTGRGLGLPQEAPLFKAGVRLIEVDAFVTDRDGNFVRGLTQEDFEIIEDGKPQDIRTFSFVDLPLERPRGAAAGRRDATVPDITINAEPARTYVILLDSPSSAAPPSAVRGLTYTTLVKRIARRFLDEAISVNGLSLQLASAPFKNDDQNGSVLVSTQIRGLDLSGNPGDRIAVSYQVFDLEGNVQAGEYKVFALDLAPDAVAAVARGGVRFVDRIAVPPGRYEIRLAADQPDGAVGSVVAHFEVPEFQDRLALSGLTLASASTAGDQTLLGDDVIASALAGQPTAVRAFPAGDMLTVFAEVYGDDRISFENLTVTGIVSEDGGGAVVRATGTPVGPADGGAPGRWGYRTQVPLAGLAPGHYVLTVEARSRRPNRTARRQIPFEVK